MPELVALDLPAGRDFVDALRAAWDQGHAVLPLDRRLARPVVEGLVETLRPGIVVDDDGAHRRPGGVPTEPGDALVVVTSGTTGQAKGAVLTHDAVSASGLATSARLGVDPGNDRWVACLPLAHIGGLSVVTRSLVTGTPCTVLERFDADEIERQGRLGATLVSLVATALGRTDASAYRAVLLGGAAPPGGLPRNVVTTYGMTETGSGIVYDGVPIEGAEVRIDGGAGEILVRGPMLFRGTGTAPIPGGKEPGSRPAMPAAWSPTAGSASSAASPRSSSPGGRRSGRRLSNSSWPGIPAWARWRSGSEPMPSGASVWWPGWCRPTKASPRPWPSSAHWWLTSSHPGPPRGSSCSWGRCRVHRAGRSAGQTCAEPRASQDDPAIRRSRRWRCTGHHRR